MFNPTLRFTGRLGTNSSSKLVPCSRALTGALTYYTCCFCFFWWEGEAPRWTHASLRIIVHIAQRKVLPQPGIQPGPSANTEPQMCTTVPVWHWSSDKEKKTFGKLVAVLFSFKEPKGYVRWNWTLWTITHWSRTQDPIHRLARNTLSM